MLKKAVDYGYHLLKKPITVNEGFSIKEITLTLIEKSTKMKELAKNW